MHRSDVDDACRRSSLEQRIPDARDEIDRLHVHGHYAVPLLRAGVDECGGVADPRVVHQHVEPIGFLPNESERSGNIRLVRDVGLNEACFGRECTSLDDIE